MSEALRRHDAPAPAPDGARPWHAAPTSRRWAGLAGAAAVVACASTTPGPVATGTPPPAASSGPAAPSAAVAPSAVPPATSTPAPPPPAPAELSGGELLFEGAGPIVALHPHVQHVYFVTVSATAGARPSSVLRRVPLLRGPMEVVAEGLPGPELALTRDTAWYPSATPPAGLLALPLDGGVPRLAANGELRWLSADRNAVFAVRGAEGGADEVVRLAAPAPTAAGSAPAAPPRAQTLARVALATGPIAALAVRDGRAAVCASPAAGAAAELQTASPTGGGFTRRGVPCTSVRYTAGGGMVVGTPDGWVFMDAEARERVVVAPAGVVAGVYGHGVYWVTAGALWRVDVRTATSPPGRLSEVTPPGTGTVSVEHLAVGSPGVYVSVGARLFRLHGAPDPADVDAEWRRAHVPRRARP